MADTSQGLTLKTSSKYIYLPKTPFPNTITLKVKASTYELGVGVGHTLSTHNKYLGINVYDIYDLLSNEKILRGMNRTDNTAMG